MPVHFLQRESDELAHLDRVSSDFKYFFRHIVEPALYGQQGTFKYSRSFELMAEYVIAVLEGDIKRLAVSIPPRNAKSQVWSCAMPLFEWLTNPPETFISVSHHDDVLNQFMASRQAIFDQTDYQRSIDWQLKTNTKDTMRNTSSGHILSMVMEFVVTGLGGNIMIVDDPIPASKADNVKHCNKIWGLYTSTLFSRLNDKLNGKIVVVSQRLSEADVIGHVQEVGYTPLVLQAIADEPTTLIFPLTGQEWHRDVGDVLNPEHEPLEILLEMKTNDEDTFLAQWQQKPPVEGSGVIAFKEIAKYDKPEEEYQEIILSIDSAGSTGVKSSNWGMTVWGKFLKNGFTYLDLLYAHANKYDYPSGKKKADEIIDTYEVDRVFIENKSTGIALIPVYKQEGKQVVAIEAIKSKDERAMAAAPFINQGRVRVPDTDLLPFTERWYQYWAYEIRGFPNAKTRDLLDSSTQVINYYSGKSFNARNFYRVK